MSCQIHAFSADTAALRNSREQLRSRASCLKNLFSSPDNKTVSSVYKKRAFLFLLTRRGRFNKTMGRKGLRGQVRQLLCLFSTHLEQEQLTLWVGSTKSQVAGLLAGSSSRVGVDTWPLLKKIKNVSCVNNLWREKNVKNIYTFYIVIVSCK